MDAPGLPSRTSLRMGQWSGPSPPPSPAQARQCRPLRRRRQTCCPWRRRWMRRRSLVLVSCPRGCSCPCPLPRSGLRQKMTLRCSHRAKPTALRALRPTVQQQQASGRSPASPYATTKMIGQTLCCAFSRLILLLRLLIAAVGRRGGPPSSSAWSLGSHSTQTRPQIRAPASYSSFRAARDSSAWSRCAVLASSALLSLFVSL